MDTFRQSYTFREILNFESPIYRHQHRARTVALRFFLFISIHIKCD